MIRKKLRLKNFDYATAGAYFVTICTNNRENLLGYFIADKSFYPIIKLSDIGKVVEKNIEQISYYNTNV